MPRKFGQNVLKISYIAPDFDVTPDDILEDFYGPIEPEKRKK
ncbi:MAG: hypothetical protein ACJ71S_13560 [Acidobacteriaceae bacterium]